MKRARLIRKLLAPVQSRRSMQPSSELMALAQEPVRWKRWLRAAWCIVLLLTGQLALMVRTPPRRWMRFAVLLSSYRSPPGHAVFAALHGVRAPPQPA